MGSSSQQPVTQQTQATRDPWTAAQPQLIDALTRAGGLVENREGYQPYTGATQAALDPNLSTGLNQLAYFANYNAGGTPGNIASRTLGMGRPGARPLERHWVRPLAAAVAD